MGFVNNFLKKRRKVFLKYKLELQNGIMYELRLYSEFEEFTDLLPVVTVRVRERQLQIFRVFDEKLSLRLDRS